MNNQIFNDFVSDVVNELKSFQTNSFNSGLGHKFGLSGRIAIRHHNIRYEATLGSYSFWPLSPLSTDKYFLGRGAGY